MHEESAKLGYKRYCRICDTEDMEWDGQLKEGAKAALRDLRPNQCVGYGTGQNNHTLYTHRCRPTP